MNIDIEDVINHIKYNLAHKYEVDAIRCLKALEQLQAENKLLKEISKLDKEIISKLKELL